MKKFRYSMESLFVIKQKLEDQAKAAYAAAKMRLSEEEERLLALQKKKEAYIEEQREVMSHFIFVPKLNALQIAVDTADERIQRQKQNVRKAEIAVKAAEERLINSMTERKTQGKSRLR